MNNIHKATLTEQLLAKPKQRAIVCINMIVLDGHHQGNTPEYDNSVEMIFDHIETTAYCFLEYEQRAYGGRPCPKHWAKPRTHIIGGTS